MISGAGLDAQLSESLARHKWAVSFNMDNGSSGLVYECLDACEDPSMPGGRICSCGWVNDFPADIDLRGAVVSVRPQYGSDGEITHMIGCLDPEAGEHRWKVNFSTELGEPILTLECIDPCDDPLHGERGLCQCAWAGDEQLDLAVDHIPVKALSVVDSQGDYDSIDYGRMPAEIGHIVAELI